MRACFEQICTLISSNYRSTTVSTIQQGDEDSDDESDAPTSTTRSSKSSKTASKSTSSSSSKKPKKVKEPKGMDAFASADDYADVLEQFDPEVYDGGSKKPLKAASDSTSSGAVKRKGSLLKRSAKRSK
jgi:hypothetical protein